MRYELVWTDSAQNELAAIWLAARDRHRIQEILDGLDRPFVERPHDLGESRNDDLRVLFEGPLRFLFRVDDEAMTVTVVSLVRISRPL
jgi:mRNA-degrading endonuclease RelE of RelBE toxin-antitoxin system